MDDRLRWEDLSLFMDEVKALTWGLLHGEILVRPEDLQFDDLSQTLGEGAGTGGGAP